MKVSTVSRQYFTQDSYKLFFFFSIFILLSNSQLSSNRVRIESDKKTILKEESRQKFSLQRQQFNISFLRPFTRKPDIGLSVFNIQIDYNIQFSINVDKENSGLQNFQFYLQGRGSPSIYNQLYIMYIATDFDELGIYMPGTKTTPNLAFTPNTNNRVQEFTFNFKNSGTTPIFGSSKRENIHVSVFLTGIIAQSEITQNGYERNFAYFSLTVTVPDNKFYKVQASIGSGGDIIIRVVQFTIVYFEIQQMSPKYLMRSNVVSVSNFGHTLFKTSASSALQSLPDNSTYENTLQYFFGLTQIQCIDGQSINILAVEKFNYNSNGRLQNLILQFETQRYTFIKKVTYNYIQYKPKNCNDSSTCGIPCGDSSIPNYRISNLQNKCAPCAYFCASCQNQFNCTSCPATRNMTGVICTCVNETLYDDQSSRECKSCFNMNYCQNCTRQGICRTCFSQFTLNNVLRSCQCQNGTYQSQIAVPFYQKGKICKQCSPYCIFCYSEQKCQSCSFKHFLAEVNNSLKCFPICNQKQKFNYTSLTCSEYNSDQTLFVDKGRLGFEWNYKLQKNEIVVDLLFSQSNMTYYFYENYRGYIYIPGSQQQKNRKQKGEFSLYHDDGNGFISGYNGEGNSIFSSVTKNKVLQEQQLYIFDQSAMKGEYYGLGQKRFYSQRFKQLSTDIQDLMYPDENNIPYGKHKLKKNNISDSANFKDALRSNLVFKLNEQSLPYTLKAFSGNHFELRVQPQKSKLSTTASIIIKNPGLVRSDLTALQTPIVTKQIDRIDYLSLSLIKSAQDMKLRTSVFVKALWGFCKYVLFAGFGWSVMPLMLILQYIFAHNYINSQIPLNLKQFLKAFEDFRNPSILFNPQRKEFDKKILNHEQIYKKVPQYEIFDFGIDFLKNCFQFFFVPALSFGGQFILIGLNYIVRKLCQRRIPLIQDYLMPRLSLHAAAYTLVQALPISFFYFGQLQDTRYHHKASPSLAYAPLNTAISYFAFFISVTFPLSFLIVIHNINERNQRVGNFDYKRVQAMMKNQNVSFEKLTYDEVLWGGDYQNKYSYIMSGAIFYAPLVVGFFLSYFIGAYPWQIAGLLVTNLLMSAFIASSSHFTSKAPQFLLFITTALLAIYELIHAGIGSNRSLSTFDQYNSGYLAIGIIYALILVGIIFSGYQIFSLVKKIYNGIIAKDGCLQLVEKKKEFEETKQKINDHFHGETIAKRKQNKEKTLIKQSYQFAYQNQASADRLVSQKNNQKVLTNYEQIKNDSGYYGLVFYRKQGQKFKYKVRQTGKQYNFSEWAHKKLLRIGGLRIDSNQKIYTNDYAFLGSASKFTKDNQQIEITQTGSKVFEKQTSKNLNQAFNMIRQNNKNDESLKQINIEGKVYKYKTDITSNKVIVLNYQNQQQRTLQKQEFLDIFIQNNNKIKLGNQQYIIKQSQGEYEQSSQKYDIINTFNRQASKKVNKQELFKIVTNQTQRLVGNSQGNIISSTSLLNSHKGYALQDQEQFVQFKNVNEKIRFTNDPNLLIINETTYKIIENQQDFTYVVNENTGQKRKIKVDEKLIKKNTLQNILVAGQTQVLIENQRYLFRMKDENNNKYIFQGINTQKYYQFTLEQLIDQFNNDNSKNQITISDQGQEYLIPQNVESLNYIRERDDEYQYELNNERFTLKKQLVDDTNENLYIDSKKRIWYKGRVIKKTGDQTFNTTLLNNSAEDFQQNIDRLGFYHIRGLSPDFQVDSKSLPSKTDIVIEKLNVYGEDLRKQVMKLQQKNPYMKFLIEDARNPRKKFYAG